MSPDPLGYSDAVSHLEKGRRLIPVDVLMANCASWDDAQIEDLGELFPYRLRWSDRFFWLRRLPPREQTQAAILALSLFIYLLGDFPRERLPLLQEEDWRADPLAWVLRDLRNKAQWSERPARSQMYRKASSYAARSHAITPFLDEVLLEALDRTEAEIPHQIFGEYEEIAFPSGWEEHESLPTTQDLAVIGIDALLSALAVFRTHSDILPKEAESDILDWNVIAVESLAWSWQFLNEPLGGSFLAHSGRVWGWPRMRMRLADSGLWFFGNEYEFLDHYSEDLDPDLDETTIWEGPGWYDVPNEEFIGRRLPAYVFLDELADQAPRYYQQFVKRWHELVACRFPVARWNGILE